MSKITRRSLARAGAAGAFGAVAAPALAQSDKRRWRMVTSWPKRLLRPGKSAERIAEASYVLAEMERLNIEALNGAAGAAGVSVRLGVPHSVASVVSPLVPLALLLLPLKLIRLSLYV